MRKTNLLGLFLLLFIGVASAQNHSMKFTRTSIGGNNIELTNGPVLGQNFTIEAFYKPDSCKSTSFIIGQDSAYTLNTVARFRRSPSISVNNFKATYYGFGDTTTAASRSIYGTKAFASHNRMWNHAVVTYDGNTLKLYMNGKLVDSLVGQKTVKPVSIKYIGGQMFGSTNEYFNGKIDEVRVWDVCKTETEIAQSNTPNAISQPLTTPNLQMLYDFEDGTATDRTGKSSATVNGAVIDGEEYSATTYPTFNWDGKGVDGNLNIKVTTMKTFNVGGNGGGKYDSVSVFAAYITDINNNPIKTLVHYGANHAYELWSYEHDFANYAPDVVSGATQVAHNKPDYTISYDLNWDGTDFNGNLVNDGTYKIKLDLNDHTEKPTSGITGIGSNYEASFVKGTAVDTIAKSLTDSSFMNMNIVWAPTELRHSISFSKLDSTSVSISNGPVLGKNFTIEAFIKPNLNATAGFILGQDSLTDKTVTATSSGLTTVTQAYARAPFINISGGHIVNYGFDTLNVSLEPVHYSKGIYNTINYNNWNHVAVSYDGSYLRLYLNGAKIDSSVLMKGATPTPIRINNIGGSKLLLNKITKSKINPTVDSLNGKTITNNFFDGKIDEVRVWDVCKTATEIFANATPNAITNPLTTANLQMLYTFDGEATDLTGKTTASLVNTTLSTATPTFDTESFLIAPRPALPWAGNGTVGTLTVNVTTTPSILPTGAGQCFKPKNIFAVWITTQDGKVVKTLRSYGGRHNYELFNYNISLGGFTADVVTGPTNTVHSAYTITWDGKDMFGNLVDDGTYYVNFDLNDHKEGFTSTTPPVAIPGSAEGNSASFSWVKGTSADVQAPDSTLCFTKMGIAWNPEGSTSINENKVENKNLNVYPSPATSQFSVSINEGITGSVRVRIYNVNGQVVSEQQIEKSSNVEVMSYNVADFNAGIYTVEVVGNNKTQQSKIVITK